MARFVSISTEREINGNVKPGRLSIVRRIFVTIPRNVIDDNFGTGCVGYTVTFRSQQPAAGARRGPDVRHEEWLTGNRNINAWKAYSDG